MAAGAVYKFSPFDVDFNLIGAIRIVWVELLKSILEKVILSSSRYRAFKNKLS